MTHQPLFRSFWQASALSLAAVVGLVVLQGAALFRQEVRDASGPPSSLVRSFAPLDDDRAAIFACSLAASVNGPALVQIGGIYDLTTDPPTLRRRFEGLDPHRVCGSGRRAFLSTCSGEVYSYELTSPCCEPILLGRHDHGYLQALECADDGSIVVATAARVAMAWNVDARKLLWRRSNIDVSSCRFAPGSRRLFAGLDTGEIVELDPLSGATVGRFLQLAGRVTSITISPGEDCLAAIDMHGNLFVIEIRISLLHWSMRCSKSGLRARFSPDGKTLAIIHPSPTDDLGLFCAFSGRRLRGLSGSMGTVAGLAVTSRGTIYAWEGGDILVWDPGQATKLRSFCPARDWGPLNRSREVHARPLGA